MNRREAIFTVSRRVDVLFLVSAYLSFLILCGSFISIEMKKLLFGETVLGFGSPLHMALFILLGSIVTLVFFLSVEGIATRAERSRLETMPKPIRQTRVAEWILKHRVSLHPSNQSDSVERSSLLRKRVFVKRNDQDRASPLDVFTECRIAHEMGHSQYRDHLMMWMYLASIAIFLAVQTYIFQSNGGFEWHLFGPTHGREVLPGALVPLLIGVLAVTRFKNFLHRREYSADLFAARVAGSDKYTSYLQHCMRKEALRAKATRPQQVWKNIKHPCYHDRLRAITGHAYNLKALLKEAPFLALFIIAFHQLGGFAVDAIFAPASNVFSEAGGYGLLSILALVIGATYLTYFVWVLFDTVRVLNAVSTKVLLAFYWKFCKAMYVFGACIIAWLAFNTELFADIFQSLPSDLNVLLIVLILFVAIALAGLAAMTSPIGALFGAAMILVLLRSMAPTVVRQFKSTFLIFAIWVSLVVAGGAANRTGHLFAAPPASPTYEGFGDYALEWSPYLFALAFVLDLLLLAKLKVASYRTQLGDKVLDSSNASVPNVKFEIQFETDTQAKRSNQERCSAFQSIEFSQRVASGTITYSDHRDP